MHPRFRSLLRYLSSSNFPYPYESSLDAGQVTFQMPTDDSCLNGLIWLPGGIDRLSILIGLPFVIKDKRQISSVSELIVRINSGLQVGQFVLDVDAGIIRFFVDHHLDDSTLTERALSWFIEGSLTAIKVYYAAFLWHIQEGQPPSEAIRLGMRLEEEFVEEPFDASTEPASRH